MPEYSPSKEKALHTRTARANSIDLGLEVLSRSDAFLRTVELAAAYEAEVAQLPKEVAVGFYYSPRTFKALARRELPYVTVGKLLGELEAKWSKPIRPYNMKDNRPLYLCEERADEQKSNWVKRNVVFMRKD